MITFKHVVEVVLHSYQVSIVTDSGSAALQPILEDWSQCC